MERYVITTSMGFINQDEKFIEIKEIIDERIDNFFIRKIKGLFKKKISSNKIHMEELQFTSWEENDEKLDAEEQRK